MFKKVKSLLAVVLSLTLIVSVFFSIDTFADDESVTSVTGITAQNQGIFGYTKITVKLDAVYSKSLGDFQSKDHATGSPTKAQLDTAAKYILINGKTFTELMEGKDWNNAVRINLAKSSGNQAYDIWVYDAAFGTRLYTTDFTLEILNGAVDGDGKAVKPCGYSFSSSKKSFTKMTDVISITASEAVDSTKIEIALDAAANKEYSGLQSADTASGSPSEALLKGVSENLIINDKSVGAIVTESGTDAINISIVSDGGKQKLVAKVADSVFGAKLYSQDFTVALTAGMVDGNDNLIVSVKYQYSAETNQFTVYVPPKPVKNITNAKVLNQDAYSLTEIQITVDSIFSQRYYAVNSAENCDPIPPDYLVDTAKKYILLNGKALADYTNPDFYLHIESSGKYQMLDLMIYDSLAGGRLCEQDFTLEFIKGATDADGNPIKPVKYKYSAATGFISAEGGLEAQVPLKESSVVMSNEIDEARGGWYFTFDTDSNYIDSATTFYSDLYYLENYDICWRDRINTEYFRNSIKNYITFTIGEETHTGPEWNAIYNKQTGNGNLLSVLLQTKDGKVQVFFYYWGKGDYHPTKNVITVNFEKGFCLPDGEGLLERASFTRSKHDVESAVNPEWWSDDGTTKDYDVIGEIRPEDIIRDEKGDVPIDVSFSFETTEGTGMFYLDILTDKSFGQDANNLFAGLNYFNNDTVWRPAIDTPEFKDSIMNKLTIKVGDGEAKSMVEWNSAWYVSIYKEPSNWKMLFHYLGADKDTFDWWNYDLELSFEEGFTLPTGDVINPITFKRDGGYAPASNGISDHWNIIAGLPGPTTMLSKITSGSLSPRKGDTKIVLPTTEGYLYEIVRSSKPHIITLDGNITPPDRNTYVSLTLQVTRLSDGASDVSRVSVLVPGTGTGSDDDENDEEINEEEEWEIVWVDEYGNEYATEFDEKVLPGTGERPITAEILVMLLSLGLVFVIAVLQRPKHSADR